MLDGTRLLTFAGAASLGIALLHVIAVPVGPPAYRFFGAGEALARLAEQGSSKPALLTLAIAAAFALFGVYALSGAALLPRLPLLRTILLGIGLIYALRGLALPQQLLALWASRPLPPRFAVFSAAALVVGLAYLAGTLLSWERLRPAR